MLVRASLGTLAVIGEEDVKTLIRPGVAYLLQYSEQGCLAGCLFCAQSSSSRASKDLLSRVIWPTVELEKVVPRMARVFERACVQSIIKPRFVEELHEIVRTLSSHGLRVSLSTTPVPVEDLELFKQEGVDYLGVGLDAFTPELAARVNKPYPFEAYLDFARRAVAVFGRGRVVVHLIVGLGEGLRDAVETIKRVYEVGCRVSLFAFTPVRGTPMGGQPRPSLRYYRIVQVASFLVSRGLPVERFLDLDEACVRVDSLEGLEDLPKALLTSGCPGCNRPYYTESPREEPYNYPSDALLPTARDVLLRLSCGAN